MSKFKIGDKVSPKIVKEAYYSGIYGNPKVILTTDLVGVIAAVNVPGVRTNGVFNCVDFELPEVFHQEGGWRSDNISWRGSFTDKELKNRK
jgi:hypothetical protein